MIAAIPFDAPAGFAWVPGPAGDHFRIATWTGRGCRAGAGFHHKACGRTPTVIEVRRDQDRRTAYGVRRHVTWWSYCAEHTYGTWVEGAEVTP
jgi:hypothetical protein